MDKIIIKNARENNLKELCVSTPRNEYTCIIGPSGSGKSTLAFNVLYNEANRKFLDALSLKNRTLGPQVEKPDVEEISGLSPAIAIKPRKLVSNVRSTVGTATDIYNHLRLLYENFSTPHCTSCGKEITIIPVDNIINDISSIKQGSSVYIISPVVREKKGNFKGVLQDLSGEGFIRFEVDGNTYIYEDIPPLKESKKHDISVIIDRFKIKDPADTRISEGVETALKLSDGFVTIRTDNGDKLYSQKYACLDCELYFDRPDLPLFSYNHPKGACPECGGLGRKMEFDGKLFFDKDLSINEGGIRYFSSIKGTAIGAWMRAIAKHGGFSLDDKISRLTKKQMGLLLYGTDEIVDMEYKSKRIEGTLKRPLEGLVTQAKRRFKDTNSDGMRKWLEQFMSSHICTECKGEKLNTFARSCLFQDKPISYYNSRSIGDLLEDFHRLAKDKADLMKNRVFEKICNEIIEKLSSLCAIGLSYLTLERSMPSLSGGEESRIQLASQVSSVLTGVTYILDEPSTGLHPADMQQLLLILKKLTTSDNTVLVVEHDDYLIKNADNIIELGPGAGSLGGQLVFSGTTSEFKKSGSPSIKYLKDSYVSPHKNDTHREPEGNKFLEIYSAAENNLKDVDIKIPLYCLNVLCGVSGSGKSTLVDSIIYPHLANRLMHSKKECGKVDKIKGINNFTTVYYVDQSPIGRNSRSNPATFLGVFDDIRKLYASLSESKQRGYGTDRFSFNAGSGRCEKCRGLGTIKVDMHFMPDIYLTCDVCDGKKFKKDTLQVTLKDKSIHDVLEMTFREAGEFFINYPHIRQKIMVMEEVGLDYLKLGQSGPTLSGGESQRLKIAQELGKTGGGHTLYILDEPTNGLHFSDIEKILEILQKLTSEGNTLLIIEHNIEVIGCADYVIELGPDGGDKGGEVVFQGFMKDFRKSGTKTAKFLK